MEDEGEGKGHVNGNPSSSLTSTVMVNGVLYRFKLRSSESTISAFNVPKSSHYVDLSEYPPGTDIYHELHWDGSRVVAKVPRWAHEKWLRKYQDPDGTITPEDTSPLRDAAAFADGGNGYHPKSASAVPVSERPYIRKAVASLVRRMASDSGPNQVDGKRPCEDQHRNSATETAGGGGADGLNPFGYPYVYVADPGEFDYQGRYAHVVKDGGRIVPERISPIIKIKMPGSRSYKEVRGGVYDKGGVYHTGKMPEILKVDAGNPSKAAPG